MAGGCCGGSEDNNEKLNDASWRRVLWICSRNDAIGNIAVVAAALGVFGTGTGWPDIAIAPILRRSETAPLR